MKDVIIMHVDQQKIKAEPATSKNNNSQDQSSENSASQNRVRGFVTVSATDYLTPRQRKTFAIMQTNTVVIDDVLYSRVTIDEFAAVAGVSRAHARRMIGELKIPVVTRQTHRRLWRDDREYSRVGKRSPVLNLPEIALSVWAYLDKFSHLGGYNGHIDRIVADLGISRTRVKHAIAYLVEHKFVYRHSQPFNRATQKQPPSRYEIIESRRFEVCPEIQKRYDAFLNPAPQGSQNRPAKVLKNRPSNSLDPESREGDQDSTQGVLENDSEGCSKSTQGGAHFSTKGVLKNRPSSSVLFSSIIFNNQSINTEGKDVELIENCALTEKPEIQNQNRLDEKNTETVDAIAVNDRCDVSAKLDDKTIDPSAEPRHNANTSDSESFQAIAETLELIRQHGETHKQRYNAKSMATFQRILRDLAASGVSSFPDADYINTARANMGGAMTQLLQDWPIELERRKLADRKTVTSGVSYVYSWTGERLTTQMSRDELEKYLPEVRRVRQRKSYFTLEDMLREFGERTFIEVKNHSEHQQKHDRDQKAWTELRAIVNRVCG